MGCRLLHPGPTTHPKELRMFRHSAELRGGGADRRRGGPQRLILNPEHNNYTLFRYADQYQQVGRPFAAYVGVARRRGGRS